MERGHISVSKNQRIRIGRNLQGQRDRQIFHVAAFLIGVGKILSLRTHRSRVSGEKYIRALVLGKCLMTSSRTALANMIYVDEAEVR